MNQDDEFLKQTRQQLNASAEHLDAATLSRLNQARQTAMQHKQGLSSFQRSLIPISIAAALSLAIINPWMQSDNEPIQPHLAEQYKVMDDLELLTSNTEFEMLEDLEFINWLVDDENAS